MHRSICLHIGLLQGKWFRPARAQAHQLYSKTRFNIVKALRKQAADMLRLSRGGRQFQAVVRLFHVRILVKRHPDPEKQVSGKSVQVPGKMVPHQPHRTLCGPSAPEEYYARLPAELALPENVPEEAREELEILFADDMTDVLAAALEEPSANDPTAPLPASSWASATSSVRGLSMVVRETVSPAVPV